MKGKLLLSQQSYINTLLQCYSSKNMKPASSSMDLSIHFISDQASKSTNKIAQMAKILYQEAIDTLMYIALRVYPDIAYAVQLLSCFLKNSRESH